MKNALLYLVLFAAGLNAQTGINANQIVCPASSVPVAAIAIPAAPGTPGGSKYMRIVCVPLDPTSFKVDLANPASPVLRFIGANFADAETPAGTIDGTNLIFTLANTPNPAKSVRLYRNGVLLTLGLDFTLAGSTITFTATAQPVAGDAVTAFYRY